MNMTSLLVRTLLLTVFSVAVAGVAVMNRVAPTMSPAVSAHVDNAAVELPTVSVRPTTAEIAEAMRADTAYEFSHAMSTHLRSTHAATSALPSLGLDMPYYSFGKALPR